MEQHLTSKDMQALLQGIQSIYTFKNSDTFGQSTLALLNQLVPNEASMVMRNGVDYNGTMESSSPDFHRLLVDIHPIAEQYVHENPLVQNPRQAIGAHMMSDLVSLNALQQFDGYHNVTKVIGYDDCMGLTLHVAPSPTRPGSMILEYYLFYLPWECFTERDRLIFNLIQPHLMQAYQTAIEFNQQQREISQLQHSLDRSGMVCLDNAGQVQFLSAQAARWLQSYFPSSSPQMKTSQLPEQVNAWVRHQLNQLNDPQEVPVAVLPLRIQQGDCQLVIRLLVDQPEVQYLLLLAEERKLPMISALKLLGLSQREAEVLDCAIQGLDNKAIALQLGVNMSTVRKHLENIYGKLQVQNRSAAIARVIEQLGFLNALPIL
jgi:DNA-binding CsgD family transcriptional regulator